MVRRLVLWRRAPLVLITSGLSGLVGFLSFFFFFLNEIWGLYKYRHPSAAAHPHFMFVQFCVTNINGGNSVLQHTLCKLREK